MNALKVDGAKEYIICHWQINTIEQIASALCLSPARIAQLCRQVGVHPISGVEQRVNGIRAANGEKTLLELASQLSCSEACIRSLCKKHDLPYAPPVKLEIEKEIDNPDYKTWSKERCRRELNKEIKDLRRQGFSRMEALAILEEFADYLASISIPGEEAAPIRQPLAPAVYSNLTTSQRIDQLLSS